MYWCVDFDRPKVGDKVLDKTERREERGKGQGQAGREKPREERGKERREIPLMINQFKVFDVWTVKNATFGRDQDAWYLPHKKADWIKVKSNIKIHSNNLPPRG